MEGALKVKSEEEKEAYDPQRHDGEVMEEVPTVEVRAEEQQQQVHLETLSSTTNISKGSIFSCRCFKSFWRARTAPRPWPTPSRLRRASSSCSPFNPNRWS